MSLAGLLHDLNIIRIRAAMGSLKAIAVSPEAAVAKAESWIKKLSYMDSSLAEEPVIPLDAVLDVYEEYMLQKDTQQTF